MELGVDYLIEEMNRYIEEAPREEKPVIPSYCPAVVRLIQVRFPSLVDNIMTLLPPLEITAQYYISKYREAGIPEEDLGIFYSLRSQDCSCQDPVGGYVSPITGAINMDLLYSKVMMVHRNPNCTENNIRINEEITSNAIRWSTTRGEANATRGVALAIDGMGNVIEFLEKVENGDIEEWTFGTSMLRRVLFRWHTGKGQSFSGG